MKKLRLHFLSAVLCLAGATTALAQANTSYANTTLPNIAPATAQEKLVYQTINDFLKALQAQTAEEAIAKTTSFFHPSLLENGKPNSNIRTALNSAFENRNMYANPVQVSAFNLISNAPNGEQTYGVQLVRMPIVGGAPQPIELHYSPDGKVTISGFKGL
jgi:hypothetical protein